MADLRGQELRDSYQNVVTRGTGNKLDNGNGVEFADLDDKASLSQVTDDVDITGGKINGTPIGQNVQRPGSFENVMIPSGNSYMASYTARGGSNATIELPFSDADNRINGIVIATTTSLFGNSNYRMTLFHVWGRMNDMGFVEISSEINGSFAITNAMSNPSAGVIRLDGEYEFTSRVSLSFNGTVLGE